MSNYAAPIEVLQAALSRIGETITSLTDGSAPALIAQANYEGIVRAALAYRGHGWTFATETIDLTQTGPVTKGMWRFAYAKPVDVMKVRSVSTNGHRLRRDDFTIQGSSILTVSDFDDLQAVVLKRAPEADWSDDFAEVVVTRLEALYTRALLERAQDARIRDKDADNMLLLALVSDKRQQPVESTEAVPLAETWRGYGRRSRSV